jgi:hypothetical protein
MTKLVGSILTKAVLNNRYYLKLIIFSCSYPLFLELPYCQYEIPVSHS